MPIRIIIEIEEIENSISVKTAGFVHHETEKEKRHSKLLYEKYHKWLAELAKNQPGCVTSQSVKFDIPRPISE